MNTAQRNFTLVGVLVALGLIGWQHYKIQELKTIEPAPAQVEPAEELVVDLPEDGNRWYSTVIYKNEDKYDTADKRLAAMLADPRMVRFVNQTTFNEWDTTHRLWEARYKKYFGGDLPGFCVQDHKGRVCYLARGDNLPQSADQLVEELSVAIERCRPRPKPDDTPKPDKPNILPDIRPDNLLPRKDRFPWAALLLPLAGGGLGLYQEWKKTVSA